MARAPKDADATPTGAKARTAKSKDVAKENNYSITIVYVQRSAELAGLPAPSAMTDLAPDATMPAEALQAGRYATGLSQNAFAAALGLSPKTINDVENGFKKPHGHTLRSIRQECERRGVRFVELPDGVGVISMREHDPTNAQRTAVPTRVAASRRKAAGA